MRRAIAGLLALVMCLMVFGVPKISDFSKRLGYNYYNLRLFLL